MRLVYLVPNAAWVFLFGDSPTRLHECPLFFSARCDAVSAAIKLGLAVSPKGVVTAAPEAAQASRELSSLGAADMASGSGLFAAIEAGNKANEAAQASR